MERVGRNEACPCGSGRKYKKCCMPREAERSAFGAALESVGLPLLAKLARFAESAAASPLEAIARDEFPFWRGQLSRSQGARIVDFLMFEFRPKHFGRRTVEQFALETGAALGDDAREMLAGWIDAPRRLYRITSWSGGFSDCVDLLAEGAAPIAVFDIETSWRPTTGEPVALRALPVGPAHACTGRPIAFTGRDAADVADAMRRRHLDFVRSERIVGIDDYLRLAPKAMDEESARGPARSTIIVPSA
jgi:hypothetical protein